MKCFYCFSNPNVSTMVTSHQRTNTHYPLGRVLQEHTCDMHTNNHNCILQTTWDKITWNTYLYRHRDYIHRYSYTHAFMVGWIDLVTRMPHTHSYEQTRYTSSKKNTQLLQMPIKRKNKYMSLWISHSRSARHLQHQRNTTHIHTRLQHSCTQI